MNIGSPVRLYQGEWFSEGAIVEIDGTHVVVDFYDWLQRYHRCELQERCEFFQVFWVPIAEGELLQDFFRSGNVD